MAKLFGLTAAQQARVAAVVQDFESPRAPGRQKLSSGSSRPTPSFWAQLTAEEGTTGKYKWKKLAPDPKGLPDEAVLVDATPAVEVDDFTAIEVNGASGLTDQNVELTFAGYDDSTPKKAIYIFAAGGAGDVLGGTVVWDGTGSAGDRTNPTTWKYHVYDENGTQVGTSLTPRMLRRVGIKRDKASDNSECFWRRDPDGTVVLMIVTEPPAAYQCTPAP